MKILVIVGSYPPFHSGGYEIRCKDVIDRLICIGHEINIITSKIPNNFQSTPMEEKQIQRILHSENNSKSLINRVLEDYKDLSLLDKVIKSFNPDIIYLWHTINLTRTIYPYLSEIPIPIVYDEGGIGLMWAWKHHGPWYNAIEYKSNFFMKNWEKKILSLFIYLLSGRLIKKKFNWPTISAYFNSELTLYNANEANVPLIKKHIIYSGIDLSRYQFKNEYTFNYPIKIITPGRFVPQKGIIDSVRLVAELLHKKNIQTQLILVGIPNDQKYLQKIKEFIEENHLETFIKFVNFVNNNEMNILYQTCDFCFFPSYQKSGFSRVPLEAMASGCMVLTYGNEGSNEVIVSHETGIIISEGDVSSVAKQIELIIQNPDLYKKIIREARLEIEQKFDMNDYVNHIENYLIKSMRTSENESSKN